MEGRSSQSQPIRAVQSRRRRFTVVERPSAAQSVVDFIREPREKHSGQSLILCEGRTADTTCSNSIQSAMTDLINDIDSLVRNDPCPATAAKDSVSGFRMQKSSVVSMFQDDQTQGEKIEMQLLGLDEGARGHVMHRLVDSYQDKVNKCLDTFKPELVLSCLRIITSLSAIKPAPKTLNHSHRTEAVLKGGEGLTDVHSNQVDPFSELDIEEAMTRDLPNFTISRLRSTIQQILRRATLRQDGTLYFPGGAQSTMATKSVQFFIWFFDFMDYLHELHLGFVEKIFTPLFKYFHDSHQLGSSGRTVTMSSAFSKLSQFSESSDFISSSEADGDTNEDVDLFSERERMRAQSKASLLQLCNEYKEIKAIYDSTEVDKVAQRLSFLKDQLEFLLDEEDEVDPELYSEESGRMVENLDMDFGTENLIRLVPDILVKLRKAGWLARRWLVCDDQKTKDLAEKLHLISEIEEKLTMRLNILVDDISKGEKKLEQETNELGKLVDREGRTDKMTMKTYNLDSQIDALENKLTQLCRERDAFAVRLAEVVAKKNLRDYQKLKFEFESNKLQRHLAERKLATLEYQRNLLADDLGLEMYFRPNVIHSTNKLQDECERLEKVLRDKREEMVNIKRALMPVQDDKVALMNRVNRNQQLPHAPWENANRRRVSDMFVHPGQAMYIRTVPTLGKSSRHPQVSQSVMRRLPVGNNRALRTVSPVSW